MKKFIIGFIIGMGIMITINVVAEENQEDSLVNLVGMTIQGQLPVTVEGVRLETPAIFINGTSFLPVRNFGEIVGYDVYFDPQGEILMTKAITEEELAELESLRDMPYKPRAEREERKDNRESETVNKFEGMTVEELEKRKKSVESRLEVRKWNVEYWEKMSNEEPSEENEKYLQLSLEELHRDEDSLQELQEAIDKLESKQ